jgi:hypothetical protein
MIFSPLTSLGPAAFLLISDLCHLTSVADVSRK